VKGLDYSEVVLAKRRATAQHQRCMAIRVPSFHEELELAIKTELGSLREVNGLDALDHFVMVFLDESLCAEETLIVKLGVTDATDVLVEVLTQGMGQSLDILALPELFHDSIPAFNPLIVIEPALCLEPIIVRAHQQVKLLGVAFPFFVGRGTAETILELCCLVFLENVANVETAPLLPDLPKGCLDFFELVHCLGQHDCQPVKEFYKSLRHR